MAIGTGWAQRAVAFFEGFADWDVCGEAEAECFAEVGGEGEVVVGWWMGCVGSEQSVCD
jgi:hypothetical protein